MELYWAWVLGGTISDFRFTIEFCNTSLIRKSKIVNRTSFCRVIGALVRIDYQAGGFSMGIGVNVLGLYLWKKGD
jgi:hypothetical protein